MAQRASGRVRKQTDHFVASPAGANGKRKRDDEVDADGDEELPEEYESPSEEEAGDGDEEPDEEELREQRSRARKPKGSAPKKPAQKKPKVVGTSLPIRNTANGARKRPSKKTKAFNVEDATAAGGIYAAIFGRDEELKTITAKWYGRFCESESRAVAEVVNFVLRCAGCDGTVDEFDIEDPDGATNKLDDLRDAYQASEPTDYPLIAKGKAAESFKTTIAEFFHVLVDTISSKDLLNSNPVLMETFQVWFPTMSSAPNRSFRHTATVAALSMMTGMCKVASTVATKISDDRRQANTERKKPRPNKGQIKTIEQGASKSSAELETIEALLRDGFDTVFMHRYRDVDPNIRRDCAAALGDWILIHPDMFLNGNHLRYLGWVLSDHAAATRGEVVKQLHRIYKQDTLGDGMGTFTEKFRSRFVELGTTDADISVRIAGIELLGLLRGASVLEPDDIDAIGGLVFDSDARIRKAVAAFFAANVNDSYADKIDELGGADSLTESLPEVDDDAYEVPRLEWLRLKALAELLSSYDSEESVNLPSQIERSAADGVLAIHASAGESRFALAINALYDKTEVLQEWQILVGFLLVDHSTSRAAGDALAQFDIECTLSEKEETILLEVLEACVRRTVVDRADKLGASKSKLSKAQKERLEDELEETAREVSAAIPKLLKKFGDIPRNAAAILKLESMLSLPALKNVQQDLVINGALIDDVRKQFMSHGTDEVLGPASHAILHAKSFGELDNPVEEKITGLWEEVTSNLAEQLNPSTIAVRGASQTEELVALSNNLLRIMRLSAVSDCTSHMEADGLPAIDDSSKTESDAAIDYLLALVLRAVPSTGPGLDAEDAALEDEIAARAAEAALFYFRWKLMSIKDTVTSSVGNATSIDELEAHTIRRDGYIDKVMQALSARKPSEDVCVTLTGCLLDLHSSSAILRQLEPQPGMRDDYIVLLTVLEDEYQKAVMKVFGAAEQNFAKLTGKKLEDAPKDAVDDDAMDEDPMSEPEDEDEEDEQTQTQQESQAVQQRKSTKMLTAVLAEQRLCILASKIIYVILAGLTKEEEDLVRKRLERNKAKLGPNYKEVLAYLDYGKVSESTKGKAKGRAKNGKVAKKPVAAKKKVSAKSNAIVAEDEMEDEIEDEESEEALRRRELIVSEDAEVEPVEEMAATNGAIAEEEDVLGD